MRLPAKSLWRDRNDRLDPETDFVEIVRNLFLHEFPWDMNQSLSFALFRTYAVPSIGALLDATGEFTERCQKRYDDTGLLLEAPTVHGFDSSEGRTAVRRINQMHKMYDISNDDMRYVLSTFVVVPKRWIDDVGWRRLTKGEQRATVNYYRELGRHMGIRDVPEDYTGFAELMDGYEREHFAYHPGSRRVADATLTLLASFYPGVVAGPVDVFSRALMDPPLLEALGYDEPGRAARALAHAGLRARARLLSVAPSRRKPFGFGDSYRMRTYGEERDYAAMGSFTPGCPVPHTATTAATAATAATV